MKDPGETGAFETEATASPRRPPPARNLFSTSDVQSTALPQLCAALGRANPVEHWHLNAGYCSIAPVLQLMQNSGVALGIVSFAQASPFLALRASQFNAGWQIEEDCIKVAA